ncbi:MAG: GntR family transcriptional regulator [Lentisphaeria bacterium]|jgi:DNA-binding LacI/PurR family transcriptional regulator
MLHRLKTLELEARNGAPRYVALKNLIVGDIQGGRLDKGNFLPPERKLCQELKLSRDTVRRAFEELTAEGYIVREPGKKRPMVGNGFPKEASFNSAIVGYITRIPLEKQADGRYTDLANVYVNLTSNLQAAALGLVYLNPVQMNLAPEQLIRQAAEAGYGGIIHFLGSGQISAAEIAELRKIAAPVVVIEGYLPQSQTGLHTVDIDNHYAGSLAARYLAENGHRRIAHLTFAGDLAWAQGRAQGFAAEARRRQLEHTVIPVARVRNPPGFGVPYRYDFKDLPEITEQLLGFGPTAVFCVNDSLAEELIGQLSARGLTVPEDLSIVGFDNVRTSVPVPLTSVSHMTMELAEKAAEIMVRQVKSPERDYLFRELVKPVLVVRNSVKRLG